MLDLQHIKSFYLDSETISERNMLREYFQYRILATIFDSKYGSVMSFLGGTAIRIVYGNDRFSEDLDFDNNNLKKSDFEDLTNQIRRSFESEGISIELSHVYKGGFRCYLRFPGLLYTYKISPHIEEKLLIQIDTQPFDYQREVEHKIINKFGVFSEVRINSVSLILAQKIAAIMQRKRILGRDLYDVMYLASLTRPDYIYLEDKLSLENKDAVKTALQKRLSHSNLERLSQDLAPFVSKEQDLARVAKFDLWLLGW